MSRISIAKEKSHLTELRDMYEHGAMSMLGDSHLDVLDECADFVGEVQNSSAVRTRVKARRLNDKMQAVRELTYIGSLDVDGDDIEEAENAVEFSKAYLDDLITDLEIFRCAEGPGISEEAFKQICDRCRQRLHANDGRRTYTQVA